MKKLTVLLALAVLACAGVAVVLLNRGHTPATRDDCYLQHVTKARTKQAAGFMMGVCNAHFRAVQSGTITDAEKAQDECYFRYVASASTRMGASIAISTCGRAGE